MFVVACDLSQAYPADSAPAPATNSAPSRGVDSEKIRARCIEGRRYVCGRVLQVSKDGLVVESGYPDLLNPPFNRSWVVTSTAEVKKPANLVEEKRPDAICVGTVLLSDIPKRPAVKPYDYVVMHAYPAGSYVYKPLPGITNVLRRFSAGLDPAVRYWLANGPENLP